MTPPRTPSARSTGAPKREPAPCKHTLRTCDDGNACTADKCDAKSGKCVINTRPDGAICNADDDGCTISDACKAGVCKVGKKLQCTNPTKPCEAAICTSTGALTFKCQVTAKDDGTACADDKKGCYIGSKCLKGVCQPGTQPRLRVYQGAASNGIAAYNHVAAETGGTVVVAASRSAAKSSKPGPMTAAVVRHMSNGLVVKYKTLAVGSSTWTEARRVLPEGDGTTWVLGTTRSTKSANIFLVRLGKAWDVVGTFEHDINGGDKIDERLVDAVRIPGGFVVSGEHIHGKTRRS